MESKKKKKTKNKKKRATNYRKKRGKEMRSIDFDSVRFGNAVWNFWGGVYLEISFFYFVKKKNEGKTKNERRGPTFQR